MVIRIKIMLGHFFGVFTADRILAHLLTDSWVKLAHLGPLPHFVAIFVEILGSLDRPSPRRRPYCQWFQLVTLSALVKHFLSFGFPMLQQGVRHLLRIVFAFV